MDHSEGAPDQDSGGQHPGLQTDPTPSRLFDLDEAAMRLRAEQEAAAILACPRDPLIRGEGLLEVFQSLPQSRRQALAPTLPALLSEIDEPFRRANAALKGIRGLAEPYRTQLLRCGSEALEQAAAEPNPERSSPLITACYQYILLRIQPAGALWSALRHPLPTG
jgi:hypothetical protein